MHAPLRVSWLAWGDERGGVATALLSNARLLRARGHGVRLLHAETGALTEAAGAQGLALQPLRHRAGSHADYLAPGFSLRGVVHRLRSQLALRAPLAAALAEQPTDLLCLIWPDLLPLAGTACRAQRIGLALEMPNTPSRYPLALNQRAYAWAVRRWQVLTLANSAYSARHMALIPGVEVQPPGLDADRFDPARVRPLGRVTLGLPEDAVVIGLIARLDPIKGADLLVEALGQLPPQHRGQPLHLLLVGGPLDSGHGRTLQARAVALGLASRVHFHDTVSDPERYWSCCDIAVNARRDAEPFGLSVIEAMLMRRPVLAHALGAPGETVTDGSTGWHYRTPTVAALADGLRRALADSGRWPEMGRAARARALQYAGPAVTDRYETLLLRHAAAARMRP